jgi:NADH:ubiquinone oxidoreductase subunit E
MHLHHNARDYNQFDLNAHGKKTIVIIDNLSCELELVVLPLSVLEQC